MSINIEVPQVYMPAGSTGQPSIREAPPASAINDGDVVLLAAGTIATVAANPATVSGIAIQYSVQNYGGSEQTTPALNGIFGYSQVNTPLVPGDAGFTKFAVLSFPALLEINLSALTGWISGGTYQANLGTAVGLAIDATTGFFVADPNASNKVATIEDVVIGPSFGSATAGVISQRVRIQFYQTALV